LARKIYSRNPKDSDIAAKGRDFEQVSEGILVDDKNFTKATIRNLGCLFCLIFQLVEFVIFQYQFLLLYQSSLKLEQISKISGKVFCLKIWLKIEPEILAQKF